MDREEREGIQGKIDIPRNEIQNDALLRQHIHTSILPILKEILSLILTHRWFNLDMSIILNPPRQSRLDGRSSLDATEAMSGAQRTGHKLKKIVDVAGTFPGTRGGDGGGVGERWVEAVEVPVQTAEAAGNDGEGAAGAAGAGGADYGVALGVFEAEEVDCFFLLPDGDVSIE